MKRRDFLQKIAAGSAAASVVAVTASCSNSDGDQGDVDVEFLFVQNATGVSLADGVLTLKRIYADTVYFSDRPDRIVERIATQEIVDQWSTGDDSFAADPPNAVLSVLGEPGPQDVAVVLGVPKIVGTDLIYDVELLGGAAEVSGDAASLFIDIIGRPLSPGSVAGMSRRSGRRTARRVSRRN